MNVPILIVVSSLLAIQVPQTRTEFVEAVAAGARGTKVETLTVDRPFDQVYRILDEKSSECLDVLVKRSGFVGTHMEVSSSDYNPTLEKIDGGSAEFSLQVVHRPRGIGHTPPPGGLYVMAADITVLGENKTEVALYRPSFGFKKIRKSFMEWAAGADAPCPKLK